MLRILGSPHLASHTPTPPYPTHPHPHPSPLTHPHPLLHHPAVPPTVLAAHCEAQCETDRPAFAPADAAGNHFLVKLRQNVQISLHDKGRAPQLLVAVGQGTRVHFSHHQTSALSLMVDDDGSLVVDDDGSLMVDDDGSLMVDDDGGSLMVDDDGRCKQRAIAISLASSQ